MWLVCAQEIAEQMFKKGINFNYVVVASGSGGTHAGLVTGFYKTSSNIIPVIGISIREKKAKQEEHVYDSIKRTAAYVRVKGNTPRDVINVFDDHVESRRGILYQHLRWLEQLKCWLGQNVLFLIRFTRAKL